MKDILIRDCLTPGSTQYFFVDYACHGRFKIPQYDKLRVMTEAECLPILNARSEMQAKLNALKPGMLVGELRKLGFERNGVSMDDLRWSYRAEPGFNIEIKTTGEKCGGKVCFDDNIQKIDKVIKFYDNYATGDRYFLEDFY